VFAIKVKTLKNAKPFLFENEKMFYLFTHDLLASSSMGHLNEMPVSLKPLFCIVIFY
jgi:hypothetical protein